MPAVLLAKGVYSGIRGRAVPRETAKGVKPAEEVAPKTRPEQAAATPQDRSEIRAIFEKSNELTAVIDEGYKVRPVQKIVKTGELDQVEIQAMKQKTGMDLAGYSREITSEKIRHAVKKHGGSAEAARGQLPLTRNDFLKVPEIARAENVVKVDVGKRQQPLIIYEKPVNGYLYVVEEVLTGKKTLQFLSMRKLKRPSARPNAGEPGPVSHVQDVRSLTSTSNIYKSEGKVNGNPGPQPPFHLTALKNYKEALTATGGGYGSRGATHPEHMRTRPGTEEASLIKDIFGPSANTSERRSQGQESAEQVRHHAMQAEGRPVIKKEVKNSSSLSQEKVDSFVDESLVRHGPRRYLPLSIVRPEEAARIKELTGVDTTGFRHEINNHDLRHAIKQHGDPVREAAVGQLPITQKDLKMIPQVLREYDQILPGSPNVNGKSVRYVKRVNGHIIVAEVLREERKTMAVKTIWKKPASVSHDTP